MKRFITVFSLVLMLLLLVACGKASDTHNAQITDKPEKTVAPTEDIYVDDEVVSTAEIDYYSICTNEDAETVESFAASVREQILNKDWKGLSENVSYPITVSGKTYADKAEFAAADWDSMLSDEFIKDIEEESCENLFCNSDGIMLGMGEVWIAEQLDDNYESMGLKVIAINA